MLKHRRSCRALWADCHFSSAGSWESRLKNENPHRTVLKLHFLHATQNQLHATQEFNTGLLQNQANAYRNLSDVMKKYRTEHRAPREETPAAGGGSAASCWHPMCAWLPGQGWCSRSAGPSVSHQLVLTWCDAKPYGYRTSRQRIKKAGHPREGIHTERNTLKKLRCPLPRLQGNTRLQHYTTPPATLFQHIHK